MSDLIYAGRVHRRAAGFSLVAVLTVGLGIGASASVFSVVDAILLRPLPYGAPDRIVAILQLPIPGIGYDVFPTNRPEALYYQRPTKSFEAVAALRGDFFNLTAAGDAERLDGARVSAAFFGVMGVKPALGRTFTPDEDRPGREHEVVLGDQVWRERFGADPGVIGRTVHLNGLSYVLVGVMPPGFDFPRAVGMPDVLTLPRAAQLWVPLALPTGPPVRGEESLLTVVGRLRPGVSLDQARAEMALVTKALEALYPDGKGWFNTRLVSLQTQLTAEARRPLLYTFLAVGLLLLIACVNLAALLVTRSLGRERELAIRAALGASRGRLVGQLLTEYLLLAITGGAFGLGLASAIVRAVARFGPAGVPRLAETALNPSVVVFALMATLMTGLLFGLLPAWSAARGGALEAIAHAGRRVVGAGRALRLRQALLLGEIALAVVLVTSSGLLARTFVHLLGVNPGFSPEHVLTFELTLPDRDYTDQKHVIGIYQRVLQGLRALPGVESAALVETLPMSGTPESTAVRIPGRPRDPQHPLIANYTIVSPDYFSSVGTPILRGRDISQADTGESEPVAVINRAMADAYWPGQDPLGQHVTPPIFPNAAKVIGVVPDEKHVALDEVPPPEMWVPFTQKVWPSMQTMDVVVRTTVEPASLAAAAREALHAVAPDLPMARVATLTAVVDESLTARRFGVVVIGGFAVVALLLASIGLFGVMSHAVAQRHSEIGLRIALGAERRDVVGVVIGQSLRVAAAGLASGSIGAVLVARLIAGFLYGVRSLDPLTFAGVAILFAALALLAAVIPARRAARIDPWRALSSD